MALIRHRVYPGGFQASALCVDLQQPMYSARSAERDAASRGARWVQFSAASQTSDIE